MNEKLFSLVLIIFGISAGGVQAFVSYCCFAATSRLLNKTEDSREFGFRHLLGYCVATLISGAWFIGMILLVARWTNQYPAWENNKSLFWIGFLAAMVILNLFGRWKNRRN